MTLLAIGGCKPFLPKLGEERQGRGVGNGGCFTSTVAVCSSRVGGATPVPSLRGREYWGAMPVEGGCRVATIRGVQEP